MHRKEKLAQEWIKNRPGGITNKKVQQWAGHDLELLTITSILLDAESLQDFQDNPRKEEFSHRSLTDLIEEYIAFPHWFKVFVQTTPHVLNIIIRNYPEQLEFAKNLLQDYRDSIAEDYLESLHSQAVVTFPIDFSGEFNLGELENFDALVRALDKEIKVANNLNLDGLPSKVFNFFLGDIEREKSKTLHYKHFTSSLEDAYEQYKNTQDILGQNIDSVQEFIKKIIKPPFLKVKGNFNRIAGDDVLNYFLENPFSKSQLAGEINAYNQSQLTKEARGELAGLAWDSAKLAAKGASLLTTGVDFMDPITTGEDIYKWIKQTSKFFADDEQIMVLYKEFSEQTLFFTFEAFVKHKMRAALAKVALDLFKVEAFEVSDEFLDSFYKEFRYSNVEESLKKQTSKNPTKMVDVAKELKKQELKRASGDVDVDKLIQNYKAPNILTRTRKKIRI